MADVFTKEKRSQIMAKVLGSGNTATEGALIRFFRMNAIKGWRRTNGIFGRPDFVFRKYRVAVFVDGCFWHSCPKHGSRPSMNALFWEKKLERNAARDRLVNLTLRTQGWKVLRVWQHELAKLNEARLTRRFRRIIPLSSHRKAALGSRRPKQTQGFPTHA